jgi:type VI secretion system protein ImpL
VVSYSNNRAYLAEIGPKAAALAKEVQAAPNTASDFVGLLPVLNDARNLASSAEFSVDHPPLSYRAGLYQGFKMRTAAEAAYDRLLEDLLLPRIALRLTKLLQEAPQDNLEVLYGRLKAYLMLHEPEYYRPDYLLAAISADWQSSLGQALPNDAQQQLVGHLRQLLSGQVRQSPFPRENALVAQARQRLGRYTAAQRVYGQLKGALADQLGASDFNLVNAIGPDAKLVFARASGKPLDEGVSGVFTRAGYRALQERLNDRRLLLLDETWVLGAPERSAAGKATDLLDERMLSEIRQLYLTDYRLAWDIYLADLRLVPAGNLDASIKLVRILSAPDSPLPKFIKAVSDETTLSETGRQAAGVADRATEAVKAAGSTAVQRVFGASVPQVGGGNDGNRAGQIERQYVDSYFEAWRRLAAPPSAGGSDTLKPLLSDLYTTLLATEAAVRSGGVPPQTDTANRVRAEAGRLPVPLRGMLEGLVNTSSSQAAGVTRSNIGAQLNAAVGDVCRNAVRGRYPFNRTATVDVPLDDFAQLFAAGGLIDDFFQKNLAQLVDTSKKPWAFRANVDGSAAGGSSSLAAFQNAAAIRDAFFRGGGRTPQFHASIRVMELDPAIKEITLDVGGQSLKQVRGEADRSKNFVWPPPDGSTQVRLLGDAGQALRFDGPWALHHLFDQARVTPGATPERFTAVLNVGGHPVTLEVVAGSVQNPFRLRELEAFNCPGRL